MHCNFSVTSSCTYQDHGGLFTGVGGIYFLSSFVNGVYKLLTVSELYQLVWRADFNIAIRKASLSKLISK